MNLPIAKNAGPPPATLDDAHRAKLWEFVPVAGYEVPRVPARSALANAWSSARRTFLGAGEEAKAPVKDEAQLRALQEVRLEHLVPALDWRAAAAALDKQLETWVRTPDRPVKFVIGQPHGGHAAILRQWGAMRGAAIIEAPDRGEILAGEARMPDGRPVSGRPWVLPNLEHFYLRHARGLSLVREVLEASESGRLGPGVIGCESWAWAYLQYVWAVPRPDALTLQAFDGPRLAQLLASGVTSPARQRIRFRNARTGNDILSVPVAVEGVGAEIAQLAAHCRGNAGTAIRYWRERLRAEPERDEAGPGEDGSEKGAVDEGEESIWVSAGMQEPAAFAELDEEIALVLHALLLHGGLPPALLPELLPLSHHQCMAILLRLRNAGLAQCRDERWSVEALAYATVRELLRSRDYLVDGF